jgi:hypothetical protein
MGVVTESTRSDEKPSTNIQSYIGGTMNILYGTASLFGKATKLIVSMTSGATSSVVSGFKQGYTGQPQQVAQVDNAKPVQTPVQKEFDFAHPEGIDTSNIDNAI